MPDPIELFISYSHKDEALKEQLEEHLTLLRRNGLIAVWHDRKIAAGKEWAGQIDQHLNTAQVILLLVSAKFLASDYCYDKEMTRALERHEAGEARVIPIILRPVDWELAPFQKLQALPTDGRPVTKWEDSDEAFFVVAQELRRTIQALSSEAPTPKPGRERPATPRPLEQTPYFTGREEVLTALRKAMESSGKAALSGIGGVGKTQTALEYVHRYRSQYNRILWTKADSSESLLTGFASLASQLGLSTAKEQDLNLVVTAVLAWLEANAGWLLILDNADDLVWRGSSCRHILLTTRAQATGGVAERVEIGEMHPEEGALFLLRRSKRIPRKATLEEASESERTLAEQISREMRGLPLALDQAGAFIEEMQRGLAEYLDLYQREGAKLRARRGRLATDHPSVPATFSVAFSRVTKENPAAADLIRCCAFLAPDAIAEEIFTAGAEELPEPLGPVAANALAFAEAVEDAGRFSLISRNPANKSIDIHRLVQEVVRDEMEEDTKRSWAERTIRALAKAFPAPKYKTWPKCERLLAHAEVAAGLIDQWSCEFEAAADLLNSTGRYMHDRARHKEAEPLYQRPSP